MPYTKQLNTFKSFGEEKIIIFSYSPSAIKTLEYCRNGHTGEGIVIKVNNRV